MKKEIFINGSMSETRIAILEDGKLVELYVERPENERMVGDIYFGRVVKVIRGMQAAFVDVGMKHDAFLHFSDIGDTIHCQDSVINVKAELSRDRINGDLVLRVGQEILAQIIKEPISNKGARITTQLSLPGRYLVLVPNDDMVGVSKKIANFKEKRRLKSLASRIKAEGFGLIIRTVAENKSEDVLMADLDMVKKSWEKIQKKVKKEKPPCLIHKDMGMTSSIIRDLFTLDIDRLVVDSRKLHREIITYVKDVAPQLAHRIELYNKKNPVFDEFSIENEIVRGLSRKVWLKSGGYIFFDHTEALVAIDVNSGKFLGKKDHEQNSLKINLEAATEIARQLRLRDIGGLIVIDFIDMQDDRNKKKLVDEFRRELRKDRAQANTTGISEFGLMEMTRERIRPSLLYSFSEPCPTCGGTGRIISKNTVLTRIERWIKRYRSQSRERKVRLTVHPEIKEFLTAGLSSKIRRIMWKHWIKIEVVADDSVGIDEFKFFSSRDNKDITDAFMA